MEHSASQIPACSRAYTGRQKADKNTCRHSEKGQPYHLTACHNQVVYLNAVHIQPQLFIRGLNICHRCLFQNRIRQISHLFVHSLQHGCPLFFRKHFQKIEDGHVPGLCLSRHICLHLFFNLLCHITAGFKSRCQHHGPLENSADFFFFFGAVRY